MGHIGSTSETGSGGDGDNFAIAQQLNRRIAVGRNLRFHLGNLAASTLSDCFLRNASNFSRSLLSCVAIIAAASKAAFFAPASPIASVPTGIPPGICAVDKSESSPWSFD